MGRLKYLDSLRGIAALAVLLQHCILTAGYSFPVVDLGRFGVILFFLLSGFVIPFSFSGPRPIQRFVVTRFYRLYPAYWASIAAALVVTTATPSQVFANITMLQTAFGEADLVGSYWSLFYELLFYALCILVFVTSRSIHLLGFLGVVCALGLFIHPAWWSTIYLGFMLAGTIARRAFVDNERPAFVWLVVVMAALSLPVLQTYRFGADDMTRGMGAGALAAMLFFMVAIVVRRSSRLLEWLGQISYSLYLFHGVVLARVPESPLVVAAAFVVSIAVGAASYNWIERPFIEIGKRATSLRRPATEVI